MGSMSPSDCDRDKCVCYTEIDHLKKSDEKQWKILDSIGTRINLLLGGVCVSCVMLAIDMFIRFVKK